MNKMKIIRKRLFDCVIASEDLHLPKMWIISVLRAIEAVLVVERYPRRAEISFQMVRPREMRALNYHYRGKDRSTDVLSFPIDPEGGMLGDIVLNPRRAAKQAEEIGQPLQDEFEYLVVHSMLHLLGYDHLTSKDKMLMRSRERAALEWLGKREIR